MIRALTASDCGWMEALHAACFDELQRWKAPFFETLLEGAGCFGYAVLENGNPAAFVLGRCAGDEGEVLTLAVHPLCQRRGYGAALMCALLQKFAAQEVQKSFLEVAITNKAARALYEKLGFSQIALRKDYYQQPAGCTPPFIDCAVMQRT